MYPDEKQFKIGKSNVKWKMGKEKSHDEEKTIKAKGNLDTISIHIK